MLEKIFPSTRIVTMIASLVTCVNLTAAAAGARGFETDIAPALHARISLDNVSQPDHPTTRNAQYAQYNPYPYNQPYSPGPQYSPVPQQYRPVPQYEFVACVHSRDECHHMAEHQGHHTWQVYYSPQYCHHHPHLACYGAHDHHH